MEQSQRQDAKTPRRQEPSEGVDALAREVIGAAIEVHRALGPGYPESVYEEALCYELELRNVPFERQCPVQAVYKGRVCGTGKMDLWVRRRLVVELKTVEAVLPKHKAQANAYLVATECQLALIFNFSVALLKDGIYRVIHNP